MLPPRIFSLHGSYVVVFLATFALLAASRRLVRNAQAREWIFAGSQVAVLLLIVDIDARGILFLVFPLLCIVYLLAKALAPEPGKTRPRGALAGAILVPVAVLAFLKYAFAGAFLTWVSGTAGWKFAPLTVVGLSYLAFKGIHFLVDTSSGRISAPTFRSYLCFMMLFPTYLSGPMDRYGRFRRDFENPLPLTRDAALEACWRIVLGLFKKTVLATLCAPFAYASYSTPALGAISVGKAWTAVYAYAFLLYFDFSGYSDLAIGSARLFGIEVPENFRNPYFKRNIIEFWTSWHITLSTWLRDYLFLPIGKALMKRKRGGGGNLPVASASYLLTFAVAGIWHGDGWNFLAWGVWHGLGLSACKAYGEWSRRLPAGYHRFMMETFPGKALSTIVTFHFVILSWTLFANDLPRAAVVYRRLLGIG